MDADQIIAAIVRGGLDNDLETIIDAATERRKKAARNFVSLLKPGDRVRLSNIRPKGIDGATGTVESVNRASAKVVIDKEFAARAGRFSASISMGIALGVPASCLSPA